MVFWQALLPSKIQQNQVCIQIMHGTNQSGIVLKQQVNTHHAIGKSSDKMNSNIDCHFCQLFYSSFPIITSKPKLIDIKVMVKTIFMTISLHLFFYLKRLFLSPLSRGPPAKAVFA